MTGVDRTPDERERREPPAGLQNREREGPGSDTEGQLPDDPRPSGEGDERTDREADETFPASDPPANY
jgi:hypothetical protein